MQISGWKWSLGLENSDATSCVKGGTTHVDLFPCNRGSVKVKVRPLGGDLVKNPLTSGPFSLSCVYVIEYDFNPYSTDLCQRRVEKKSTLLPCHCGDHIIRQLLLLLQPKVHQYLLWDYFLGGQEDDKKKSTSICTYKWKVVQKIGVQESVMAFKSLFFLYKRMNHIWFHSWKTFL